jgi:hypothetical protein
MRVNRFIFGSLMFTLFSVSLLWAQSSDCQECNSGFSLTRVQLLCVAKRIDRLLVRPTDPVYFDAGGCDASAGTMMPTVPRITSPPAAPSAEAKWLQLSKKQLQCLRAKLPALQASNRDPIFISPSDMECGGSP